jgi:hypothetical protein
MATPVENSQVDRRTAGSVTNGVTPLGGSLSVLIGSMHPLGANEKGILR